VRICTLGDLLLDVVVRLDRPLATGDDAPAVTRAGAGGQAANVAAWAAALGADARFVGKRAHDAAGAVVSDELAAAGVELAGPVVSGRTGVVVSFVGPDGERSMASDRGVAPELRPDEVDAEWFGDCNVLHVSGYALLRAPIQDAAVRAASAARAVGGKVSVDLATWSAMADVGASRFRERVAVIAPDVVFAGERELATIGGGAPAPVVVLKRGAAGCVLLHDGRIEEYAAVPADAVDSTGAGDALAAGFLVGGVGLGLEAAARCVAKLGAFP
jgi:sugar/nucleoside kinase (ribokinase family)